jgi:serine/threonine protein kinase
MGDEEEYVPLEIVEPPRIGAYIFRGVIGEGAFSRVRLVIHEPTREYYACKIIPKNRVGNENVQHRFEIEIRANQTLHHPGIVHLFDLLTDSNNFYVIIEFCPNGDLYQYIITSGFVPEDEARVFTRQLLEALQYVHSMDISHRDLKPENLLLDKTGVLKVSDFGLASFMHPDSLVITACGSPCYASPECLSGEPYNGRTTDVWSVGVIVYAMVTGALPWTETNQSGIFNQIRVGEYHIPKILSGDCRTFLKRLLTVDITKRATIAQALQHPWLTHVEVEWEACPAVLVSLKRVDRFFSTYDFDDDESIVGKMKVVTMPTQKNFELTVADKWLWRSQKGRRDVRTPLEAGAAWHRSDHSPRQALVPRIPRIGPRGAKIAKPVVRKSGP